MTRTPDYFPGDREEEAIIFLSGSNLPSKNGEVRYVSGSGFKFFEEGGVKTFSSSFGLTQEEHKTIRQLVHLVEEGGPFEGFTSNAYREIYPVSIFPTSCIWYTDSSKTLKIVEETVTYNANKTISTDQWKVYAADGITTLATVTDTITYDGIFESSRIRTIA